MVTFQFSKLTKRVICEPKEIIEALNSRYISQFTRELNGDHPDVDVSFIPHIMFTILDQILLPACMLKLASKAIVSIVCITL